MMQAERMSTAEWYKHVRTWAPERYCDGEASITPDVAGPNEAHAWLIEVQLGRVALEPGDHVAVEVHVGWQPDQGRPFCYGRLPYANQWNPGYNASPRFEFEEGIKHTSVVSEPDRTNRLFILDARIEEGRVPTRGKFRIYLADPDGMLLRCPWFAQDVPVPVAVRKKDEDYYRRLREIPVVRVHGQHPVQWKVAATPEASGGSIRIQAIAADGENLNPCEHGDGPAVLPCEGWGDVAFLREEGYLGAPVWRASVARDKEAGPRIEVLNRESGLYGRSNPVAPDLYEGLGVYFGDLHGQSDRSIGFGTEEEYFAWARDGELLDFVAPANHYGGREVASEALFEATVALCDAYEAPGQFAALYGYEWAGGGHGHRNVYYGEQAGKLLSSKVEGRYERLTHFWGDLEAQGVPVLTVPHHTKFISRMDWKEYHAEFQRLVEVCSCWGNSEQGSGHSVQRALAMGHRLGVVGGTDTHFSQPGRPALGPFDLGGVTAVMAPELRRGAVWQALYDRRCYATTGARILLDFRVNGEMMGRSVPTGGARRVSGQVIGTAPLAWVEVVRNNEVWQRVEVDRERAAFTFEDGEPFGDIALKPQVPPSGRFAFYYLRVQQRDRHWAMSSPIWIEEK